MEIIKIDKSYLTDVKSILQKAYLPLLEKYHDEQKNPANKTAEDILFDLGRENSDAYLLMLDKKPIGYVRVGERTKGEFSIADLAILPSHQGNGYAQYFLKEIEKIYYMAEKWSLVTIQEEAKLCHLYEKFGYIQKGVLEEVNENMHFVLYVKVCKKRFS